MPLFWLNIRKLARILLFSQRDPSRPANALDRIKRWINRGSERLLPLNCFLPHKTRMDAGFARSVHSVLPSFIPSNNDGYCWRGRWTQFERQLRQRINRQRTTQTKLHFTLPRYSPVVIRSLPISSAATTVSKTRGGQAVHINHPRHSAPASCAGCFGQ